jgi:hypothetical protein
MEAPPKISRPSQQQQQQLQPIVDDYSIFFVEGSDCAYLSPLTISSSTSLELNAGVLRFDPIN